MIDFLRSLFSDKIPTTASYENKRNLQESSYAKYMEILESVNYKRYTELKSFVGSPAYNDQLNKVKSLAYLNSPESRLDIRFDELRVNKDVKAYIKSGQNTDSPLVQEYINIEKQVSAVEHINKVKFLKDKNRHKKSEPYVLAIELKELEKSDEVKTLGKLQKKYLTLFKEEELWVSKLYDDFSKNTIDTGRWLTHPFLAESMMNGKTFAMAEDLSIPVSENIESSNGLRMHILAQNKEGLAWDFKTGFVNKNFNFTSATINTSNSFRQLYGRFEAKVRVKTASDLYYAFWMAADLKLPHVNIFKIEKDRVAVSAYGRDKSSDQMLKYKLNSDFYIFTFLWTESEMIWNINGKNVYSCPNFINEPMYIAFSNGVTGDNAAKATPATMEIDWVKCHRKK